MLCKLDKSGLRLIVPASSAPPTPSASHSSTTRTYPLLQHPRTHVYHTHTLTAFIDVVRAGCTNTVENLITPGECMSPTGTHMLHIRSTPIVDGTYLTRREVVAVQWLDTPCAKTTDASPVYHDCASSNMRRLSATTQTKERVWTFLTHTTRQLEAFVAQTLVNRVGHSSRRRVGRTLNLLLTATVATDRTFKTRAIGCFVFSRTTWTRP